MPQDAAFRVVARRKPKAGNFGLWVNIYYLSGNKRFQAGGMYKSRREADAIAKPHRHDCIFIEFKK